MKIVEIEVKKLIPYVRNQKKHPEEQIKKIMQAQVSRTERLVKADDVINNDRTLSESEADLQQQVAALHQKYLVLGKQHEKA